MVSPKVLPSSCFCFKDFQVWKGHNKRVCAHQDYVSYTLHVSIHYKNINTLYIWCPQKYHSCPLFALKMSMFENAQERQKRSKAKSKGSVHIGIMSASHCTYPFMHCTYPYMVFTKVILSSAFCLQNVSSLERHKLKNLCLSTLYQLSIAHINSFPKFKRIGHMMSTKVLLSSTFCLKNL